jgi:hypothetical protein
MDTRYENALNLAADRRYREAKGAVAELLRADPADAAALVLLGKIEFYLGNDGATRSAFELALTHEPENFAAYLGLRYFRERRLKRIGIGLLLTALLVIGAGAVFFYLHRAAADAVLLKTLTALVTEKSSLLEKRLEAVGAAQERQAEKSARLEELLKELVKERGKDAALYERLKKDLEALLEAESKKSE